jgi:glycogen phosphorylase
MTHNENNDLTPKVREFREDMRTGLSSEILSRSILDHLFYTLGRVPPIATQNDWYLSLAYTVRDRLVKNWIETLILMRKDNRLVAYLSAEFLIGPQLGNNLLNLGIYESCKEAVEKLGLNFDDLINREGEPGLGNGGLGRLAACYLESLATLRVPAIGYGIRYEFGIFDQVIKDGWQVEITDKWLAPGHPWEICHPEVAYQVGFKGYTERVIDEEGLWRVRWVPGRVVKGIAYDVPIPGYRVAVTNLLRLWKAEAVESFDFQGFNQGDYFGAVEGKVASETISKILYPNDEPDIGKRLRLYQQYFFVSCSLQDMIRIHLFTFPTLDNFHQRFAMQLNDTHPSIAVAELMRLLMDEHRMGWDQAWAITQKAIAFTNHTLLPEALEKWPLPLFADALPRHLEIIYEINRRFLDEVRLKYPLDDQRLSRLSLIDERGEKYVRMAHLASLGSHAINGVAALHSELLKKDVFRDFYELYPERFYNVTNGVTPRRWMVLYNPDLSALITRKLGDRWIVHPEEELRGLEKFAEDQGFQQEWQQIKHGNKERLSVFIKEQTGILVDPDTFFDIQVKRIHEYKRQHLNILHVVTLYNRIKKNPGLEITPRTFIFGGKAAPGYFMAKLIIKLINSVAEVVNKDPDVAGRLKVAFIPDFNVKNSQWIYPAADLSEQISTAGKEASGTGNMKFSMNGALTIGTLDGANIEIREEVGAENFFLFGLTAEVVYQLKARGYRPMDYVHSNTELKAVIDLIGSGFLSHGNRDLFKPLVDCLLYDDPFLLLADYQSYVDCQEEVSRTYRDRNLWTTKSILNVARIGKFSSDRSIREYCEKIWQVKPIETRGTEQADFRGAGSLLSREEAEAMASIFK